MAQELLVAEQIEAGKKFVRDFCDYATVSAAFWVNPPDSEEWYLYIAFDGNGGTSIRNAYEEVIKRLGSLRNPWLDPFRIKLVKTADPVAQDAIEFRDYYSVDYPIPYNRSSLGGMSIDGAYIYPHQSVMQPVP